MQKSQTSNLSSFGGGLKEDHCFSLAKSVALVYDLRMKTPILRTIAFAGHLAGLLWLPFHS
jgi:hypothetical protein